MALNLQTTTVKILLADDDIDDRIFFENALKEIPLKTHLTTVADGEQLMDYLYKQLQNPPDVLFLDLSMPRKSGIECLVEIKEHFDFRNIPVFMFSTAYQRDMVYEQNLIQMIFNIGANNFIRKPSDIRLLKDIIYQALCKVIDDKGKLDIKNEKDGQNKTLSGR